MTRLDLPQVADLDQVLQVPGLIASGVDRDSEIAKVFRMGDARQGRYRLHAAELLGLIDRIGKGKRLVTALGRNVMATSRQARNSLARQIISSFKPALTIAAILAARPSGMRGTDVTNEVAKLPGFSARASTLTWRVRAMLHWLEKTGFVSRSGDQYQLTPVGAKMAPKRIPPVSAPQFPARKRGKIRRSKQRVVDVVLRNAIEKAAIKEATRYYSADGFDVVDRQLENVGWDLDIDDGSLACNVEVKGTTLRQFKVQLTPNEYEKMMANPQTYRVCVVADALGSPVLNEFVYDSDRQCWVDPRSHRPLVIQVVASAVLTLG